MAGDGQNPEFDIQRIKANRFTPAQRLREACDRLRRRAEHLARVLRKQTRDTALMIGMVVRDQDGGQRQAFALKHLEHRACITGVDNHRCGAIAQQPNIVILEGRDSDYVKHRFIVGEVRKMSIPGIDTWLQTPQGRYVMAWEQARVDTMVADVFGYNALQLGLPQLDLLGQNRIPLRQTAGESGDVDVLCDLRQLPFSAHSIDLVVMPHVLEFHDDPHRILREVERVLIPEGQLIITGFNPFSLWGLRRRLPNGSNNFPWTGDYISVQRLKDWLQLLGFEVDRGNFGCYAPPCEQESWLKHWHFMEAAGDRWWGFAGGVYLIRAVKHVHGMRLIMPAWKQRKLPAKALTAVTHKEHSQHGQ
jgi:SAM-dependent methyltransferase